MYQSIANILIVIHKISFLTVKSINRMNNQPTSKELRIQNIQNQYKQIKKKSDFIIQLGKKLDRSPLTIRSYWFSNFWSIPSEFEDQVLIEINNRLSEQKQPAKIKDHAN